MEVTSCLVHTFQMKLAGLQTLRGIAANLVVFFHCFAIGMLPKYGFKSQFESITFVRNFWSGVDLFFCISGFVMCYSYLNSKVSGHYFFLSRAIRIVPLYWIFTIANYILLAVLGSQPDCKWLFQSLFFFVDLDVRLPILPAGWTLQYEMFFYLLFAIALIFFRKQRFVTLNVMLLSTIILQTKHNLLLEFSFGGIAYLLYKSNFVIRFKVPLLCLFLAIDIVNLLVFEERFATTYRVFIFGIPALFIVTSIASMNMPKKSLQTTGDYSYSLYLIHFPLLSICFKFFSNHVSGSTPAWILTVVSVSICNIAAFFSWKYIEAPMTDFLRNRFLNIS